MKRLLSFAVLLAMAGESTLVVQAAPPPARKRAAPGDRIRYDDLFDSGDSQNKHYWASVVPQADVLVGSFVRIRDGKTPTPTDAAPQIRPEVRLTVGPTTIQLTSSPDRRAMHD